MKVIEIIISPQGEARVQTKGFAGAACQEASRFLEQALGHPQAQRRLHHDPRCVVGQPGDARR